MKRYTSAMKPSKTPEILLHQIGQIQRLEAGKLCVLREGPHGPYYNLQYWHGGRNHTEYIRADQLAAAQENVAAHAQFQALIDEYVQMVSAQSREERHAAVKKKLRARTSSSPRKPRSRG